MNGFMDENYLLETETARRLFFDYAQDMPIFDYHCHLPVQEIAEDRHFTNITEIWLGGDHYKWRAMRTNGVPEEYITGSKSDKEKFIKWAETVPYTIGNPLFQWTYLELRRYFGIEGYFTPKTAEAVWEKCNEKIKSPDFSARHLIERSNVRALCTTDDPVDSLEFHKQLQQDPSFAVKVMPAFRPDMALEIGRSEFNGWVERLEAAAKTSIQTLEDYLTALRQRIQTFHDMGCRVADHGALTVGFFTQVTEADVKRIFAKRADAATISPEEAVQFRAGMLQFFAKEYHRCGWAMQLHLGSLRDTNTRMLKLLGQNTGFDTIADYALANELVGFFDALESTDQLPKTILYCLNPRDNYLLGALIGNYQKEIPGKIQFGSAWWFNDHETGMMDQMKALANLGLLSRFVGMLTDSRSFLSYPRHEYFRRILCNLIGSWVERGDCYRDFDLLGEIVQGICFNNIKNYLAVEV